MRIAMSLSRRCASRLVVIGGKLERLLEGREREVGTRSPELVHGVPATGDPERDRADRLRCVDIERGVADDDHLARLDVATVHRGDASDRDTRDLVSIARVRPEGTDREVPVQMAALELDAGAPLQP